MDDFLGPLSFVALGAAMMWLIDWMVRLWTQAKEGAERSEAERILSSHGMDARVYMPGFSVDDQQLRQALEKMAYTSRMSGSRISASTGTSPRLKALTGATRSGTVICGCCR